MPRANSEESPRSRDVSLSSARCCSSRLGAVSWRSIRAGSVESADRCEKKEPTMFAYKGSTAMITGASKGLGAAFAKELAGRGMNLVLIARSIDTLQDLADSRPPHLAGARSEKVRCLSWTVQ